MPTALSHAIVFIERLGWVGAPVGAPFPFAFVFLLAASFLATLPNLNAIRSGDKLFFGLTVTKVGAAGPGGAARVIAGLIAALLRPVVRRCRWGAARLAFCA